MDQEHDLLKAIREEVDLAGAEHEERRDKYDEAIKYFYGDLPAPEDDCDNDYSSLVSTDVADVIEAVCSEIMPAFSGPAPVEFEPTSPDDEDQVALETQAVNHTVNTCGGYMAINMAVKDALLRRAGVVKVYWEDRTEATYEQHDDIPQAMLPEITQRLQETQSVTVIEGDLDEERGTASGLFREHRQVSQPRIDPVPLDEFLISANVATPNLKEARFKAHQRPVSRSELVEMGYDKELVAGLQSCAHQDMRVGRARTYDDTELQSGHRSTEYVMVVESYYNIDLDDDGIAEMRRVMTAGGSQGTDELLDQEPWDEQPFCLGVPFLGIYSWDGVSYFDKLKMIQDGKTDLMRELQNATRRNVRQRIGIIEGDADPDDALTSVLGGLVRCKTPNAMFALPDVQVPQVAYSFIELLDEMRKDKGGGAVDSAAQAQALAGDTAHGLERMMSAAEQITAMVAKNLCETLIKDIYRKMHKLLRQYRQDQMMLPGSAGWTATQPSQWPERQDMVVSMGMSVGERGRRTAALAGIKQDHAQDQQTGQAGILSDSNATYQARVDMARMSGLPNPEQYYVNPASPEAQQAQQAQAQQAQQQQEQQMQMQQQNMEFQYNLMSTIEQIKADAKIQAQQMAEQTKWMQTQAQLAEKMFGHRVDLAGIEQEADSDEAQREIDRLQAVRSVGNG